MELSTLKAVTRGIPRLNRKNLQEKLLDVILDSDRVGLMPIDLAKTILRLYQDDRLYSNIGFELTLEGALIIETEKSIQLFSEDAALLNLAGKLKKMMGRD